MMKKILLSAAVLLIIPFTASAMDVLSDSELSAIHAQAGIVLLEFNDIQYHEHLGELPVWYSKEAPVTGFKIAGGFSNSEFIDRYAPGGNALEFNDIDVYMDQGGLEIWYQAEGVAMGFVFAEGSGLALQINSIGNGGPNSTRALGLYSQGTDLQGSYPDIFDYSNTVDPETGESVFEFKPMTTQCLDDMPLFSEMIDNARGDGISGVARRAKLSGIVMGMLTAETHPVRGSYDQFDILVTTAANVLERTTVAMDHAETDTWSFGTIYMTGGTSTTLDGYVEIVTMATYLAAKGMI